MKSYKHNNTLVVTIDRFLIERIGNKVLDELERQGIFNGNNVFRLLQYSDVQTILKYGTDRTEERSFDYWLIDRRQKSKPENNADEADKACLSCKEAYSFDDVVEVSKTYDERRELLVGCPFSERTHLTKQGFKTDCPTYMTVAGSTRVIWGHPSKSIEDDRKWTMLFIETVDKLRFCGDKPPLYTINLVYNADDLEEFDERMFRFKDNVKPTEALKCIMKAEFLKYSPSDVESVIRA
jgi:hypothetical protein